MSDNPSAFPSGDMRGCEPGYGMTLRDWFAGHALAATIARGFELAAIGGDWAWAANVSYMLADAMLAERAKGGAQ